MKFYKFDDYLKQRFSKEQIKEIEEAAKLEVESLLAIQGQVAKDVSHYMEEENIGFNEMVLKLGTSPTQLKKIQKGEANLTIAYLAHLYALMKQPINIRKISTKS